MVMGRMMMVEYSRRVGINELEIGQRNRYRQGVNTRERMKIWTMQ
jgi:hypothetical protein